MNILKDVLYALWQHNFEIFSNFSLVFVIYLLVFIVLVLENGVLPAAFLPGDSLLIFTGVLISKGTLSFPITLSLLTVAASLGSWMSYLQGRFLENNKFIQSCFARLPKYYHHRAYQMFHNHGLFVALIVSRFIAFIRTLLPIIVGFSGLCSFRFHFFNWISAFLWVLVLTVLGFILGNTIVF
ncbi:Inner membrane protein YqjA [Blochmannia endosymbiont of Camponotus (Colobopsis) obliquus]|nr:Inner membrane protein YqjA [Blochmannia endosymbiont of Camponotus (Colobopsis) obliquus]